MSETKELKQYLDEGGLSKYHKLLSQKIADDILKATGPIGVKVDAIDTVLSNISGGVLDATQQFSEDISSLSLSVSTLSSTVSTLSSTALTNGSNISKLSSSLRTLNTRVGTLEKSSDNVLKEVIGYDDVDSKPSFGTDDFGTISKINTELKSVNTKLDRINTTGFKIAEIDPKTFDQYGIGADVKAAYQLIDPLSKPVNGSEIIKIAKDTGLVAIRVTKVALDATNATEEPAYNTPGSGNYLTFVYVNNENLYDITSIDIATTYSTDIFKDGLTVDSSKNVYVKSANDYIKVDNSGLIAQVATSIDGASSGSSKLADAYSVKEYVESCIIDPSTIPAMFKSNKVS